MKNHEVYQFAGFSAEEIEKLKIERTFHESNPGASLFMFNSKIMQFQSSGSNLQNEETVEGVVINQARYRSNLFILLDNLPHAVDELHRKKIPDEIIITTLSDISLWYRYYLRELGVVGIPDDKIYWFNHHFAGKLFRLGRLQFELTAMNIPTALLHVGSPILKVHVPEEGKLIGEQCDESFLQAERFFRDIYPFHYQAFMLESWFNTSEFLQILPKSSNIRQFAERFTPIEYIAEKSGELYRRILGESAFHSGEVDYELKTSLQKIIFPYFKEGRLFENGVGIIMRDPKPSYQN